MKPRLVEFKSANGRVVLTIYTDRSGKECRWSVRRSNVEVLAASSEGFRTFAGAKRNFRRVRNALNMVIVLGSS